VYAFSESRRKLLWRRRTGAAVQAVVSVVDNGLLAASLDNFAYLLSPQEGRPDLATPASWAHTGPTLCWVRWSSIHPDVDRQRGGPGSSGRQAGKHLTRLAKENSSSAAPIVVGDLVLIATSHGMLAFAAPAARPSEISCVDRKKPGRRRVSDFVHLSRLFFQVSDGPREVRPRESSPWTSISNAENEQDPLRVKVYQTNQRDGRDYQSGIPPLRPHRFETGEADGTDH